ncbi:MAG: MarR family transcriptional regulator, partial [Alphaproteobacteria bacterium]
MLVISGSRLYGSVYIVDIITEPMSIASDPEPLRLLTANRWALPVMALLSERSGARFAVIAARFGLSSHSLTRCLQHLRDAGWVVPNPGHGHPLRPEYV